MVNHYTFGPIGIYKPTRVLENAPRASDLGTNILFLENKIGTCSVLRKKADEETSDMAVNALRNLQTKGIDLQSLDVMIVITQHPDSYGLPHTSAIVHEKMGLPNTCATFDISLGCSGYVYGLAAITGFMQAIGAKNGVLITADPYSKTVREDDRNTVLIFGDAACATYVTNDVDTGWQLIGGRYGSEGSGSDSLCINESRELFMNGRDVFNFAAKRIPNEITSLLKETGIAKDNIDKFLLHQGSKYIVNALTRRLNLPPENVPINIENLGNSISSTIPLLLNDIEGDKNIKCVLICGFGVGFSYASAILKRK